MRGLKKIPVKRNSKTVRPVTMTINMKPEKAFFTGENRKLAGKNNITRTSAKSVCQYIPSGVMKEPERIMSITTPWVPTLTYWLWNGFEPISVVPVSTRPRMQNLPLTARSIFSFRLSYLSRFILRYSARVDIYSASSRIAPALSGYRSSSSGIRAFTLALGSRLRISRIRPRLIRRQSV